MHQSGTKNMYEILIIIFLSWLFDNAVLANIGRINKNYSWGDHLWFQYFYYFFISNRLNNIKTNILWK